MEFQPVDKAQIEAMRQLASNPDASPEAVATLAAALADMMERHNATKSYVDGQLRKFRDGMMQR